VVTTIVGTVVSGEDQGSNGVGVFGQPGRTALTGKNFTLVYTFDDTKGQPTPPVTINGKVVQTGIQTTTTSSPGTAALTINGVTISFGTGTGAGVTLFSSVRKTINTNPGSLNYAISDYRTNSGVTTYLAGMSANTGFVNPAWAASADWRASFSSPYQVNLPSGGCIGQFQYYQQNPPAEADGCLSPISVTVSGPITPAPSPHIYFLDVSTGNYVDVTSNTRPQTVVVGQPIYLFAIPTATPAHPNAWSVSGNPIGGYLLTAPVVPPCAAVTNPAPGCAEIAPPDLTKPSIETYWTVPGNYQVIYNSTPVVTANFLASGPTSVAEATTFPGSPQILTFTNPSAIDLSFGNGRIAPYSTGIMSLATANQPLHPGVFQWVQVITSDAITYKSVIGQSKLCTFGIGLDNYYFYPAITDTGIPNPLGNNLATDNPFILISPPPAQTGETAVATATRALKAELFLLWQANLPAAIPIPLGNVLWEVDYSAVQNQTTKNWTASGSGKILTPFASSTAYATWNSVVKNDNLSCQ
jgi:hypothetical protein